MFFCFGIVNCAGVLGCPIRPLLCLCYTSSIVFRNHRPFAVMTSLLALAALAAPLVAAIPRGYPDCVNGPLANNTVCNTSADPLARATALINAFTTAEKLGNMGSEAPGVPRLGLPAYTWWSEGLHGIAYSPGVNFNNAGNYSYATSFPQPILMGAAFDDPLIEAVATVVSTEARAFSNVGMAGLEYVICISGVFGG